MALTYIINKLKRRHAGFTNNNSYGDIKVYTREPIDYSKTFEDTMQPDNIVILEAKELLYLITCLRQKTIPDNLDCSYQIILEKIASFEQALVLRNFSPKHVSCAKYLVCAALDEAKADADSNIDATKLQIASKGFVSHFYNERLGGEKFFSIVNNLSEDMHNNLRLVRFAYLLLKLGFKGKYGVAESGMSMLQSIENQLYLSIMSYHRSKVLYNPQRVQQTKTGRIFLLTVLLIWISCSVALYFVFDKILLHKAQNIESILDSYDHSTIDQNLFINTSFEPLLNAQHVTSSGSDLSAIDTKYLIKNKINSNI